jgi:hypothetical protein
MDERLRAVSHKGKTICARCFNNLTEVERNGHTVNETSPSLNTKTKCSECGETCWSFTMYQAEWED